MVVPSGATTYYIDRMEITMAKQSENMEYQKAINHIVQMVKDGQLIVGSKIPSERDAVWDWLKAAMVPAITLPRIPVLLSEA